MNPIGAIILATFALLWVVAGARHLSSRWFLLLVAMSILLSASIVYAATHVRMRGGSIKFNGGIYGIAVALEAILIALAVVIFKRTDRKQYLIPIIALIVGAHFFGMVPALNSNEFWWIGGAMCLLPILTMSILPQNIWAPVVGLGCASILWFSAVRAFF